MGSQLKKNWSLFEIANIPSEKQSETATKMLQLYHFKGKSTDDQNNLWLISSSGKGAYADSYLNNLVQKSLMLGSFSPDADFYMTPLINTTPQKLYEGFPTYSENKTFENDEQLDTFQKTLMRWSGIVRPKCVISFSLGAPKLRYLNIAEHVLEKLTELSERPLYEFGSEKYDELDENPYANSKVTLDQSFASWLNSQEIGYIDFTLDVSKRSFEEVSQSDWKIHVGPSLKWLIEGLRFLPKQEDPVEQIEIIPALDIPAEFLS